MAIDAAAFQRIWADPPSIGTAIVLVAGGGAARGLGEWSSEGAVGFYTSILLAFLVWLLASWLVATLGRYVATRQVRFSTVLRTCALAAAPALVLALGHAPLEHPFDVVLWGVAHFAMMVAFVMAVREALAIDTTRALFLSVATLTLGLLTLLALELLLSEPNVLL